MATQGHLPNYFSDPLWHALTAMRVESAGSSITFAAKLARDTGWAQDHAEAVVAEYRRFLYLAGTEEQPVSPSDAVDRAWHLHLTYSRHYWDVLCGEILGRPLHHDPNPGGAAEDVRHADQYARTLAAYERAFGAPPPASLWPRSVPAAAQAVTRRPAAMGVAAAAGASLLLAACSAASAGGFGLVGWLPFVFVGVIFLIIVIAFASRGQHNGKRGNGDCGGSSCGSSTSSNDSSYDSGSSDSGGSSCGGGGCGGGGD